MKILGMMAALLLLAGCSDKPEAKPRPRIGPVGLIRATADEMGCLQTVSEVPLTGPGAFACIKPLGRCGCQLRLNVWTEQRGQEALVSWLMIYVLNCPPDVGVNETTALIAPYVAEGKREELRDFVSRARLERRADEINRYAVAQDAMFDRIHINAVIDPGTETPTREIDVDTIPREPGAHLLTSSVTYAPCDRGE